MSGLFDDDNDSKRTLGIRDRQILYRNAKGTCQNPRCGKKIEFDEMQIGHKTAWSRGGSTTFRNSVCLCYRCNKLQGTDNWATFLKKQGVQDEGSTIKAALGSLNMSQLKALAKNHNTKVKGRVEEDMFSSYNMAPSKKQYVNKLAGIVTEAEIKSLPKELKTIKKKKRRSSSDDWGW